MMSKIEKVLIVTNLYPVPWGPNRASFNKQQFDRIALEKSTALIILLPWTEWMKHRSECTSSDLLRYCPYFYIPKVGRRLVPFFQFISLLFFIPWIKKYNPSVLYSAWAFPDSVGVSMLNSFLKLPFFVKVHGTDVNENTQYLSRKKLMNKWLSKAKNIFCASNALSEKLQDIGIPKNKLCVNYNGVNSDIFYPCENQIPNKIVFVGSLIETKGVKELIDAFLELSLNLPDVSLNIIGEGPLKPYLAEKISEKGLNVNLLGSIPLIDVAKEVRTSGLLVLPSYREGVPNVVLEAFASGVPVVATNVGGIPEVVNENVGVLVNAQNTHELSKAIMKAMTTSWDKNVILGHAKQFSWKDNVDHVFEKMDS